MLHRPWLLSLSVLLSASTSLYASERIAGIAIASDDHVYVWHKDGMVTSGTSGSFEKYTHARPYSLPPGKAAADIVAISIAGSDDHVYAWYDDGTVSSGTSTDLDKYRGLYNYTVPAGKTIASIVGIGIAKDNRVYAWYDDITVSIGTTDDLDKHRAAEYYSLPIGKIAANIVEIDIGKSNDHVYAWYTDGTASSGTSSHLDSRRPSFGYVPAHVLYRWWGPEPVSLSPRPRAAALPTELSTQLYETTAAERHPGLIDQHPRSIDAVGVPAVARPRPKPDEDPPDTGMGQSPAYSPPLFSRSGSIDPMIAVGNQYLIVSDTGSIAFFDKQRQPLQEKHGMPTSMPAAEFFAGFIAKTNADGTPNETDINRYLGLPKPCDSSDYPQTRSSNRFCIGVLYDTRVLFDSTSKRFFIISQARHQLWDGYYAAVLSDVEDTSKCDQEVLARKNVCNFLTSQYDDLVRRYVAFAVSKTEDPRDGFHQYIITESNNRDWPWMAVNGNALVTSHQGEHAAGPVATVFSVSAVKAGDQHPPYFRYYSKDVKDILAVLPPTHHENATGLIFLLGKNKGKRLDIFAFPQTNDPWTAPPLLNTFVNFSTEKPTVLGAVYRRNQMYFADPYLVEEEGKAQRYSVHVVRVPVERLGGALIAASTDPAKGFLERLFGRNASSDSAEDRISYERPSIAVNKNGDMLIGYGRYPFVSENTLYPEARYTLWYASEVKQRRSYLLQVGQGATTRTINLQLDYTTAVVDPADDTSFWVALPYVDSNGKYRTVFGKIVP